jgi:HEAT repeat protein
MDSGPRSLAAFLLAGLCFSASGAFAQSEELRALDERLKSPKDNEKVNALYDAAKKMGSAEALSRIPPFFAYVNPYVSDRAIAAFSEAKDAAPFATVVKTALCDGDVKIRRGALEALGRTRLPYSADVLLTPLADSDAECKQLALYILASKPPASPPPELAKLAGPQERDVKVRAAALWALGAAGGGAATTATLTTALKDKDPSVRVGALLGLEAAKGDVAHAVKALSDPERRVRLTALEWVARARPAEAVAPLIANLVKEVGRPKHETLQALKSITLRDFDLDGAAWRSWWEGVEKTFKTPPLDKPMKGESRPAEASAVDTKVDLPRYHEFVVRSDRVAFLVDVSGSMRAKYTPAGETAAGKGERTRLEVAAEALHDVIAKLPKGTRVTVVVFNNQPLRYRDSGKAGASQWIDPGVKSAADVKKYVLAIGASSSTNISDSLELVLEDPDVDTIYLLTDGAPSAGKRNLTSRIVEWAKRVTTFTRVEVNTIAFGAADRDAEFLRKLAEATGGTSLRK